MVTMASVQTKTVPVYLDEIGKAAALETVDIRPQVSGRIVNIAFTDGQDVKKGQLLFEIDPAPYKAALDQASAAVQQSKAQLVLANLDYERVKNLDEKVESKADKDAKQSAVDVAVAQVAASVAAVATAQVKLDYCTIKSPLDGRIGQRLIDLGNVVSEVNPQSMLTITRLDPIYADFTATESELSRVRQYMSQGTLQTLVWLPGDKEPKAGKLTFLDNSVQDGTGTVKLRATVENADKHFWPGQFVRVRLVLYTIENAPLIPATAVQIGQTGPYVYVVEGDGANQTAALRPITPGQHQLINSPNPGEPAVDKIVVSNGLTAGQRVVVTGQALLMPGAKVRELPPPPASMPPTSQPTTSATTAPKAASALMWHGFSTHASDEAHTMPLPGKSHRQPGLFDAGFSSVAALDVRKQLAWVTNPCHVSAAMGAGMQGAA